MKLQDLHQQFPPTAVHWRIGSTDKTKTRGMALAYLNARDVMDRLDDICGAENWQDSYVETATGRVVCTISVRIGDRWVRKSDGAGKTDIEGDKGGISDAFKRAAVKWGIGRYLYDIDSPWVAIETFGKTSKIKDSEYGKLAKALQGERVPDTKPKVASRDEFEAFTKGIREQGDLDCLDDYWAKQAALFEAMPADWRVTLFNEFVSQGCDVAESLPALQTFWSSYNESIKQLSAEDLGVVTTKKEAAKTRLSVPLGNGANGQDGMGRELTPLDAG